MQKFFKQNNLAYEVSISRLEVPKEDNWNSFSCTPCPGIGKKYPNGTIGKLNPQMDNLMIKF